MDTIGTERVESIRIVYDDDGIKELWARLGTPVQLDNGASAAIRREVEGWQQVTSGHKVVFALICETLLAQ